MRHHDQSPMLALTAVRPRVSWGWKAAALGLAGLLAVPSLAAARTLTVGPTGQYALPSQAAAAAVNGDTVEIQAGDYGADTTVWKQNDLVIRAVGGPVVLVGGASLAQGKGIWLTTGNNVIISGINFSKAAVRDRNGAGIRHEGGDLRIIGCVFHDNENGLLATSRAGANILIESSEFYANGYGDGRSHNIYISTAARFVMRYSASYGAKVGHQIKTRAAANEIAYNFLADGANGTASYTIDLSNGGDSLVIGNVMQKSAKASNGTFVMYAAEGQKFAGSRLTAIHNTLVNNRSAGGFFANRDTTTSAVLSNNFMVGQGTAVSGPAELAGNLQLRSAGLREKATGLLKALDGQAAAATPGLTVTDGDPGFVNADVLDFRLTSISPAVDAGAVLPAALIPTAEYLSPLLGRARVQIGAADVGAYEYRPAQ
ncbi:right-handed parallel beta-helix repeat-containing protein [Rhodospirillum rubrum]|uniref:right-handed parallel beta-helix repeat-containing protein n=2 Tax=Rhodospirillum rubrum TaxID=1085 RepID=UPI001F5C0283|nr:right-handed parallel beta-helix repeat-containing protein [Rhodospirillum rubrum]